jgi:hypothetical protein
MKVTIINQVRELLERGLNPLEISQRMRIDLDLVRMAIDTINNLVT